MSKEQRNYQVLRLDEDALKQLRTTMESMRGEVDLTRWAPTPSKGIKLEGTGVVMTYEGSDLSAEDMR